MDKWMGFCVLRENGTTMLAKRGEPETDGKMMPLALFGNVW